MNDEELFRGTLMFVRKLISRATGLLALVTCLFIHPTQAAWDLNMPVGVTPISENAYDIHMLMLYICTIIGVLVFGAMTWSIIHHRKSKAHKPAQFYHSTFAEIVWTIIPFIILVGFAVPATKALIDMEDTSAADMTIKITGYQWMWRYDYLEDEVTIFSSLALSSRAAMYDDPTKVENYLLEVDNDIVLPVGKKIRFILTSDDVIHAWWVPALGMKKDAIPGYVNEFWAYIREPGTYRGQCAELCGKDHGFMPIVVIAKNENEYQNWLTTRQVGQKTETLAATQSWDMSELNRQAETL